MKRHVIADEPRIAHEERTMRNARADRSTEGVDRDFRTTRGSTCTPRERMLWSASLARFVWWQRLPEGKWAPKGVHDRAVVRRLRVEVADAHDDLLRKAALTGSALPQPAALGSSVEEILDVIDASLDAREVRDREDEEASA